MSSLFTFRHMNEVIDTNALAIACCGQGQYRQALQLFREALGMLRYLVDTKPRDNESVDMNVSPSCEYSRGLLYTSPAFLPDSLCPEDKECANFSVYSKLFGIQVCDSQQDTLDRDMLLDLIAAVIIYNIGFIHYATSKTCGSFTTSLRLSKQYYTFSEEILTKRFAAGHGIDDVQWLSLVCLNNSALVDELTLDFESFTRKSSKIEEIVFEPGFVNKGGVTFFLAGSFLAKRDSLLTLAPAA